MYKLQYPLFELDEVNDTIYRYVDIKTYLHTVFLVYIQISSSPKQLICKQVCYLF